MNLDHRGRSNDDCPLIIKLQQEIKDLKMRFHSLRGCAANTGNYFAGHANDHPYGPPSLTLADDDLPFGDETVKACAEEDGGKCYSCGGYFPASSCVANTLDEGERVPVCENCAEGRVG